jgi:hypothetical protein
MKKNIQKMKILILIFEFTFLMNVKSREILDDAAVDSIEVVENKKDWSQISPEDLVRFNQNDKHECNRAKS